MMAALDDYLKRWHLTDPEPLAQTATSSIYTATFHEARVVLKLLTPLGVQDEQEGAIALQYWNGDGAVRLLNMDRSAHLLEYASGESLVEMVRRGDDARAAEIIAHTLNRLHNSPSTPPAGLKPLDRWFRALFQRARTDAESSQNTVFTRAAAVAKTLLAEPREVRVLHGDIHHDNIRLHPSRGWLAFDPKGLIGERTYDACNTLCNPVALPALVLDPTRLMHTATTLARIMQIPLPRLLAYTYTYAALSASWSLEVGQDADLALGVATIVEPQLGLD